MGWRDWNQYQGAETGAHAVTQTIMEANIRGLADKSRMVNGRPTSLAELGYTDVGLDDGWCSWLGLVLEKDPPHTHTHTTTTTTTTSTPTSQA